VGRYVAMLRSINIGSRNRIAMPDLRALVESLGYGDVTTYLQSGNVVLSGKGSASSVAGSITEAIKDQLGLEVPVVVRTKSQLEKIAASSPYAEVEGDPKLFHVTFLAEAPKGESLKKLAGPPDRFGNDEFKVVGPDVYLYIPGGYGETKLNNSFFEKRLGVVATTRNWRSVTALAEMVGAACP
jgi:uncharacterized protein (DUF1697 family)